MPVLEGAHNTNAPHSEFNEVHGDHYKVTYNIIYNGSEAGTFPFSWRPPNPQRPLDEIDFREDDSNWNQMLRACARGTTPCQSTLASAIKAGASQTIITVPYGAWNNGNRDITVKGGWGGWTDPCGSWSYSEDAEVSLTFYGSDIYYMGYKDPAGGSVQVTIDGLPTTLDLYAPSRLCGILHRKTGLDSKQHHKITISLAGKSPQNMSHTQPRITFHAFVVLTADKFTVAPAPTINSGLPEIRACPKETTSCHATLASTVKRSAGETVVTVPYGAWNNGNRDITVKGGWGGWTDPCGSWSYSGDAEVSLTFYGSSIYYVGYKYDVGGSVRVTIDGLATTIDLYAASRMCGVLYSKTGLDSKQHHKITIALTGASPQMMSNTRPHITFHSFILTTGMIFK